MYNTLTSEEKRIIEEQETEHPFSGEYNNFFKDGIYICRRCNNPLFSSEAKFYSSSGWPSFDQDFPDSINRMLDPDGTRVEMRCFNCSAHLGHIFEGEKITPKNTRYCANSLSIKFIPKGKKLPKILYE